MASVFDVAKYILLKSSPMTTWKLQKLVYYCQAWSLVWDDEPLFNEEIQAWANGPVCSELYDTHKGLYSINAEHLIKGDPGRLTQDNMDTIDAVLESYGNYNGQQLSNATHNESPWQIARGDLPLGERGNNVISLESMLEYYSALFSKYSEPDDPSI